MAALPDHLSPQPAGREALSPQVRESHQRERVLSAAAGVFAKHGYWAVTVDEIGAAAKIGTGSFYKLFEGKEELFLGVFERALASTREAIAALALAQRSWPEQVSYGLGELLAQIASDPDSAGVVLVEAPSATAAAQARYGEALEELATLLRRGRALELPAQLPKSFEEGILGGIASVLVERLVAGEIAGLEELAPELSEIVLTPYLGKAEVERLLGARGDARA